MPIHVQMGPVTPGKSDLHSQPQMLRTAVKSCEASLQQACSCLLPGCGQRAAAERSGSLIPNPSSAGHAAKLPAAISQSSLLHHLRSSLLGWLVLWLCLQGRGWKKLHLWWGLGEHRNKKQLKGKRHRGFSSKGEWTHHHWWLLLLLSQLVWTGMRVLQCSLPEGQENPAQLPPCPASAHQHSSCPPAAALPAPTPGPALLAIRHTIPPSPRSSLNSSINALTSAQPHFSNSASFKEALKLLCWRFLEDVAFIQENQGIFIRNHCKSIQENDSPAAPGTAGHILWSHPWGPDLRRHLEASKPLLPPHQ